MSCVSEWSFRGSCCLSYVLNCGVVLYPNVTMSEDLLMRETPYLAGSKDIFGADGVVSS